MPAPSVELDQRRPLALVIVGDRARMRAPSSCTRFVMHIQLNGETVELPDGATVADLLVQLQLTERRVAVELNLDIVPRSQHASRQLQPGDVLEVVHAIGGG